jgi:hypothetical protein
LLAAWAADTAAVRVAILRLVTTGAVTHDKLPPGAAGAGGQITVETALLRRGITADRATLDLGADRTADIGGRATEGTPLIVGTASGVDSVATDLLSVEIRWTLMAVREVRARSAGGTWGTRSLTTDFVAAASSIVCHRIADTTNTALMAGRAAPVWIWDTDAV